MSDAKNSSEKDSQANLGAACFRCRGFRHACDRKKPSCSRCHRRGIHCVYPEAAPTLKKLQKATETLGDRIKKFNERMKSNDLKPSTIETNSCASSPYPESILSSSVYSDSEEDVVSDQHRPKRRMKSGKVASTAHFSVYPCTKCFKDLQQCDLLQPTCTRCSANQFECCYKKTEPKANHVSQVLNTMNKVMDQWQDSIDRMAKDFAQKTRDFSAKANNSLKIKQNQTAFKITTTKKGISVESNVNSYNDLSSLVDQFENSMTIKPPSKPAPNNTNKNIKSTFSSLFQQKKKSDSDSMNLDFQDPVSPDDTLSVHTTSSFAVINDWAHPTDALPQDYPVEITQEMTDKLIDLYCRTPCCSLIRVPIINISEFLPSYYNPDESKRPSKVLIYAICAITARNAFQLHVWSKRSLSASHQFNMGKALSVAYCLRGRELLSECFDEPSLDHCKAAVLLAYANYQNGYPGVIYFYEWIAYSMASDLGLYDPHRELKCDETMLIWIIYYFNVWYRALQGVDIVSSFGSSQCRPSLDTMPEIFPFKPLDDNESQIDDYVWNTWAFLFRLQVMRDQTITAINSQNSNSPDLPEALLRIQKSLEEFHSQLPAGWQTDSLDYNMGFSDVQMDSPISSYGSTVCWSPQMSSSSSTVETCSVNTFNMNDHECHQVSIISFSKYCAQLVQLHYYISQILLHEPFVPMYEAPTSGIARESLDVMLNAANQISDLIESMAQKKQNSCYVPLSLFLFANVVYKKLMTYQDHYYDLGKLGLLRSLDICKLSIGYMHDFELAHSLVNTIEQDIQQMLQTQVNVHSILKLSPQAFFDPKLTQQTEIEIEMT